MTSAKDAILIWTKSNFLVTDGIVASCDTEEWDNFIKKRIIPALIYYLSIFTKSIQVKGTEKY